MTDVSGETSWFNIYNAACLVRLPKLENCLNSQKKKRDATYAVRLENNHGERQT